MAVDNIARGMAASAQGGGGGGGGGITIKSKEVETTFQSNIYVQPFSKVAYIMYDSDIKRDNIIKVSPSDALTNINATYWADRICLATSADISTVKFLIYYLD